MALVTSPISNQDGTSTDKQSSRDEETISNVIIGRNECPKFSTSQRTVALMLGSNGHLRASCEDQLTANSITVVAAGNTTTADVSETGNVADGVTLDDVAATNSEVAGHRGDGGDGGAVESPGEGKVESKTPSRPASSCSSGSSSSSSDIQQHLQSMFCLLRPEETLKMAVKLESLRTGRTRYLVVVSRTVTSKRHNNTGTPYHAGSGGGGGGNSSIVNNNSSAWQMATTTTTAATSNQQPASTIGAIVSRTAPITCPAGQQQHLRHGSICETFSGSDTYVSSLDNCVLSVAASSGVRAAGGCRIDQCDSKANSRLISSTVSADTLTAAQGSGTVCAPSTSPSGSGISPPDDDTALSDKRDCSNDAAYDAGEQQQQQQPHPNSTSAMPSAEGGKKIEESCLLGIDCNERTTVGLVLKVLADTSIRLDGDGGFSVSSCGKQHIFKPVSVQAMWSALQTLHKASFKAREHNFFAGGPSHDWVAYYEAHIDSDRSCLNEWNAMDSLESRRPPSPGSIRNKPTEREETESVIRSKLKEVMMSVDLDDVTSKFIRGRLEELLDMDLGEYKPFIDAEMLVILGQMDAPTEIFDHVYLGSEWNASNLEELQRNGVHHILNVTREIDNFFPGLFHYCNVRVYDDEKTDLLRHWDNTFKFISRAKMEGSKVLVHCKMGISRSASVVIAYAMKANGWDFEHALRHVKEKRSCIKPNKNFLMQLETYQGMLDAMKNKEKLQRSKSETNLKLTGAKEGRSLPGSEPTPLIQALNGAGGGQGGGKKHGSPTHATIPHGKDIVVAGGEKIGSEVDETDEGETIRGRARTRQIKHATVAAAAAVSRQLPLQQDESAGELAVQEGGGEGGGDALATKQNPTSATSRAAKFLANLFLPQAYSPWNACDGRVCTRASSGALKRHKSLSPEPLTPRWPDSASEFESSSLAYAEKRFAEPNKASRTRTMLELDAVADPSGGGAGGGPSGRRKQQSYSLEHLHGGALEMRSPCTETKTIRMPCGNGQNYSVSPNQIVHLQDKMPLSCVRVPATAVKTSANGATNVANRPGGFLRKLFPSSGNSNVGATGGPDVPGSATLTTTVPSTTATTTTTATTSATIIPTSSSAPVSNVKTIVNELECNSGGAVGATTIPVAPPPLLSDPAAALTASVPIPIASVAAEAAAVAVASAIREASRKSVSQDGAETSAPSSPDAKATADQCVAAGEESGSTPGDVKADPPPICWTSSAQIIQQCSSAPDCTEPPPAADEAVEPEGSKLAPEKSVMRQCSWSSCDSSCIADEPRGIGTYVACFSQRCVPGGAPVTVATTTVRSGSAPPIEEKEDIPWHPGTVKRTKKRIEERGTNAALIKWSTPSGGGSTVEKCIHECGAAPGILCPAAYAAYRAQRKQTADLGHAADTFQPRGRQGMVSSSYARLSASAPDSYNLYAGTGGGGNKGGAANAGNEPLPAKRQTKLNHQHSFAGTGDSLRTGGEPAVRVIFRGAPVTDRSPQQAGREMDDTAAEEDAFSAGKVRNLKMNFEAKSNDRRPGQKKVRSLPSSPVAVHVSMGGQATKRPPPSAQSTVTPTPISSPAAAAANNNQSKTPPEDVTVRDLVDRYEVHGPRMRPTGAHSLSRTQRPRSVYEPLKPAAGTVAKPYTPTVLSHSTSQQRLDESQQRPPVPPIVRGLVIPPQLGSNSPHFNNNNTPSTTTTHRSPGGGGGGGSSISAAATNNNARNNNNSRQVFQQQQQQQQGGLAVEGKRTQQHGRTHPLAKISPNPRHHHHHHLHHHHLVHHQYAVGQPHRHIGASPGPGVSGTTGPSATTVTANAYNTM